MAVHLGSRGGRVKGSSDYYDEVLYDEWDTFLVFEFISAATSYLASHLGSRGGWGERQQ